MSATGRGAVRKIEDWYPTPAWCVRRLMERLPYLPGGGAWLEPGAGRGNIIAAARPFKPLVEWTAVELREECREPLNAVGAHEVLITDYLRLPVPEPRFSVAIGNPPYSRAMEFIEKSLQVADVVAFLLRLNFLGSQKRAAFHHEHPADVYVLPDRPSFTGKGTDSIEYAWFVWYPGAWRAGRRDRGRIEVLPLTPEAEKKQDAGQLGFVDPQQEVAA